MSWKESRVRDEKVKFIADVLRAERSFSDLCKIYDISRKTGYKWIERFQETGPAGLENMSRRPQACSHSTPDGIVKQVSELRFKHPTWGARKLLARLETIKPETEWPAASTIGEILRRAGLVQRSKKKRRVTPCADPLKNVTEPNQLWCMDFKGHFRCGDGQRCDPLTITDAHTRYVIRCQAVNKTDFFHVDAVCDAAMREYGLPQRIRTDNGPPFASLSVLGLSRLSIKWLHLGIVHERIKPGQPQQNGRHERMHRTLKKDTATPPAFNVAEQQDRFNGFRKSFNEERPHEALGLKTPSSLYVASAQSLPVALSEFTYETDFVVRRVRHGGEIKMKGGQIYIAELLHGELVGLAEMEEDLYEVHLGRLILGELDTDLMTFTARR